MSEDEAAIRTLIERWFAASKAGDTATVLDLMTDDVVFMTPGREPFGKAEFAAMSEGMKGMTFEGSSTIRELQLLGDWAYLRSHLALRITGPDGVLRKRAGYTLTLLRKGADGRWRLARDANLLTGVE